MRTPGLLLTLALLCAAAWFAGRRQGESVPAPAQTRIRVAPELKTEEPPPPVASAPPVAAKPPAPDVRGKLARTEASDLAALEQEYEARLLEDRSFADVLFDALRLEPDPVKMSFLANLLASDPPLRNAEAWQERFLKLAESDPSFERRAAALLFLQQAESIRPVFDRLLSLAENDRELSPHALAALKGLPETRRPDPRVTALAGRIADREPDPTLRGIALRVEDDPAHAARFLADPDRTVRMQASRVSTDRAAIGAALKAEADAEVRELLQYRLDELK